MSIRILHGDCREVLRTLPDAAFAACVTDAPYELGFMGKGWDRTGIANDVDMWAEVLRVLKPGAHLAAFGGTRTFHRMACAIEDAGFEIRDCLMWLTAQGFPKSHNLPPFSLIETHQTFEGLGTSLKPAYEPIILARKPLAGTVAANVLAHGCGALNIDACRVPASGRPRREVAPCRNDVTCNPNSLSGRMDGSLQSSRAVGTTDLGRWPANVLHDGSPEVEAAFAAFGERPGQQGDLKDHRGARPTKTCFGNMGSAADHLKRGDTGSASRFFMTAKADASDRAGSKHPTVKPTALMRWLVQLVTPPGGAVLDPFAGSGSTGLAADQLGFDATLIEQDAEYVADIRRKIVGDAPLFAEVL